MKALRLFLFAESSDRSAPDLFSGCYSSRCRVSRAPATHNHVSLGHKSLRLEWRGATRTSDGQLWFGPHRLRQRARYRAVQSGLFTNRGVSRPNSAFACVAEKRDWHKTDYDAPARMRCRQSSYNVARAPFEPRISTLWAAWVQDHPIRYSLAHDVLDVSTKHCIRVRALGLEPTCGERSPPQIRGAQQSAFSLSG